MSTFKFKERIPPFQGGTIEAISRVLGDTKHGLTGAEIGRLLGDSQIPDPDPSLTKWTRLYNAFVSFQNEHHVADHIIVFIKRAMEPTRYVEDREKFGWRQSRLNEVLAFVGYRVRDDGKVGRAQRASTLDEAAALAGRLKVELQRRSAHEEVLRFCKTEIVHENLFHAVLEAMKSITSRLRSLSGLSGDGTELVQACFNGKSPALRINDLKTSTDVGEQRGFSNLLVGLYGTFRNPTAHEAKIEWPLTEQDALDILTTISLVHRKLDRARARQTS